MNVLAIWEDNDASLSSQVTAVQSNQHTQWYFVLVRDMGKQIRMYWQQQLVIYILYINTAIRVHQKEWEKHNIRCPPVWVTGDLP